MQTRTCQHDHGRMRCEGDKISRRPARLRLENPCLRALVAYLWLKAGSRGDAQVNASTVGDIRWEPIRWWPPHFRSGLRRTTSPNAVNPRAIESPHCLPVTCNVEPCEQPDGQWFAYSNRFVKSVWQSFFLFRYELSHNTDC